MSRSLVRFFLPLSLLVAIFFSTSLIVNYNNTNVAAEVIVLDAATNRTISDKVERDNDFVVTGHYPAGSVLLLSHSIVKSVFINASFAPNVHLNILNFTVEEFLVIDSAVNATSNGTLPFGCDPLSKSSADETALGFVQISVINVTLKHGKLVLSPFFCSAGTRRDETLFVSAVFESVNVVYQNNVRETLVVDEDSVSNSTVSIFPRISSAFAHNLSVAITSLVVRNSHLRCETSCPRPLNFSYDAETRLGSSLGCSLFALGQQQQQQQRFNDIADVEGTDGTTRLLPRPPFASSTLQWVSNNGKNNYTGGLIDIVSNVFEEVPSSAAGCSAVPVENPPNYRSLVNISLLLQQQYAELSSAGAAGTKSFELNVENNTFRGFMVDHLLGINLSQIERESTVVPPRGVSIRIARNEFIANPGGYHEKGALKMYVQVFDVKSEFAATNSTATATSTSRTRDQILQDRIRSETFLQQNNGCRLSTTGASSGSASDALGVGGGVCILSNVFDVRHNCRKFQHECFRRVKLAEVNGSEQPEETTRAFYVDSFALNNIRLHIVKPASLSRVDIAENQAFVGGGIRNVNLYFNDGNFYSGPGTNGLEDVPANPYYEVPLLRDTIEIGFVNVSNNNFTSNPVYSLAVNGPTPGYPDAYVNGEYWFYWRPQKEIVVGGAAFIQLVNDYKFRVYQLNASNNIVFYNGTTAEFVPDAFQILVPRMAGPVVVFNNTMLGVTLVAYDALRFCGIKVMGDPFDPSSSGVTQPSRVSSAAPQVGIYVSHNKLTCINGSDTLRGIGILAFRVEDIVVAHNNMALSNLARTISGINFDNLTLCGNIVIAHNELILRSRAQSVSCVNAFSSIVQIRETLRLIDTVCRTHMLRNQVATVVGDLAFADLRSLFVPPGAELFDPVTGAFNAGAVATPGKTSLRVSVDRLVHDCFGTVCISVNVQAGSLKSLIVSNARVHHVTASSSSVVTLAFLTKGKTPIEYTTEISVTDIDAHQQDPYSAFVVQAVSNYLDDSLRLRQDQDAFVQAPPIEVDRISFARIRQVTLAKLDDGTARASSSVSTASALSLDSILRLNNVVVVALFITLSVKFHHLIFDDVRCSNCLPGCFLLTPPTDIRFLGPRCSKINGTVVRTRLRAQAVFTRKPLSVFASLKPSPSEAILFDQCDIFDSLSATLVAPTSTNSASPTREATVSLNVTEPATTTPVVPPPRVLPPPKSKTSAQKAADGILVIGGALSGVVAPSLSGLAGFSRARSVLGVINDFAEGNCNDDDDNKDGGGDGGNDDDEEEEVPMVAESPTRWSIAGAKKQGYNAGLLVGNLLLLLAFSISFVGGYYLMKKMQRRREGGAVKFTTFVELVSKSQATGVFSFGTLMFLSPTLTAGLMLVTQPQVPILWRGVGFIFGVALILVGSFGFSYWASYKREKVEKFVIVKPSLADVGNRSHRHRDHRQSTCRDVLDGCKNVLLAVVGPEGEWELPSSNSSSTSSSSSYPMNTSHRNAQPLTGRRITSTDRLHFGLAVPLFEGYSDRFQNFFVFEIVALSILSVGPVISSHVPGNGGCVAHAVVVLLTLFAFLCLLIRYRPYVDLLSRITAPATTIVEIVTIAIALSGVKVAVLESLMVALSFFQIIVSLTAFGFWFISSFMPFFRKLFRKVLVSSRGETDWRTMQRESGERLRRLCRGERERRERGRGRRGRRNNDDDDDDDGEQGGVELLDPTHRQELMTSRRRVEMRSGGSARAPSTKHSNSNSNSNDNYNGKSTSPALNSSSYIQDQRTIRAASARSRRDHYPDTRGGGVVVAASDNESALDLLRPTRTKPTTSTLCYPSSSSPNPRRHRPSANPVADASNHGTSGPGLDRRIISSSNSGRPLSPSSTHPSKTRDSRAVAARSAHSPAESSAENNTNIKNSKSTNQTNVSVNKTQISSNSLSLRSSRPNPYRDDRI